MFVYIYIFFFVSNPLENFIIIICFNFSRAAYLYIKLQVLATGLIVSDYDDHKVSALKQSIVYIFVGKNFSSGRVVKVQKVFFVSFFSVHVQ